MSVRGSAGEINALTAAQTNKDGARLPAKRQNTTWEQQQERAGHDNSTNLGTLSSAEPTQTRWSRPEPERSPLLTWCCVCCALFVPLSADWALTVLAEQRAESWELRPPRKTRPAGQRADRPGNWSNRRCRAVRLQTAFMVVVGSEGGRGGERKRGRGGSFSTWLTSDPCKILGADRVLLYGSFWSAVKGPCVEKI